MRHGITRFANGPDGSSVAPKRRGGVFPKGLLALLLALAAAMAFASSALASYQIVGYFGGSGSAGGQFTTPRAVAVNSTGNGEGANAGDLYVLDGSNPQRIQQLDSDGTFIRTFGWGVQDGSDAFQICTSGCRAPVVPSSAGAAGSLNFATGIAVDQATGNVFVADGNNKRVDIFASDGTFEGAFGFGVNTGAAAFEFCSTTCQVGLGGSSAGEFGSGPGYLAVDPTSGNLYVTDPNNRRVNEYSFSLNGSNQVTEATFVLAFGWDVAATGDSGDTAPINQFEVCATACQPGTSGNGVGQFSNNQPVSIAVNSIGVVYTTSEGGYAQSFTPSGGSFTPAFFASDLTSLRQVGIGLDDHVFFTKSFSSGSSTCPDGTTNQSEYRLYEFDEAGASQDGGFQGMTCSGIQTFFGMAVNLNSGDMYLPVSGAQRDPTRGLLILNDSDPTADITSVTPTTSGAVVDASINPDLSPTYPNAVGITYQLQYKLSADSTWINFGSPVNVGPGTTEIPVAITLGGLQGNTPYDIRLVLSRPYGGSYIPGPPTSITTLPVPPSIETFSSSHITSSSADLHVRLNPHGEDTTVRFEYGTTLAYGQSTPEIDAGAALTVVPVDAHLVGLEPVLYHFRVVATNATGTTISRDQTFTFYPPPCPNATLRQQTGSQGLPDCRAYEIVSPEDAGNIVLRTVGTPGPYASQPSRLAFSGALGAIAGADSTEGTVIDQYVASRTDSGWETHYVGIPGSRTVSAWLAAGDLNFDRFVAFTDDGSDNRPFVYDAAGNFLGNWPGGSDDIPGAKETEGAWQPSPDFSHMAFSSNNINFDPEGTGLTVAPGSAYDYDVATGTVTVISKTANGDDIPQEPGMTGDPGEYIHFPQMGMTASSEARPSATPLNPSVSTDGSHILMSTSAGPPVGIFSAVLPPMRLYMRVNDAVTYEVSRGHDVVYVGATADGTRVFFTSPEQLTPDDHDASVDLYMWHETGDTLTRVSSGDGGTGDSDTCSAGWTTGCDVATVDGTAETDSPVASESGDVYFYSPELLDGPANGLVNAQNLYVYRNGAVQFVATLSGSGTQPLTRLQVSPDGAHAAFITASRLTSYDNAGFDEMYSYDAVDRQLICVSCIPSGDPPAHDVEGSRSGLFMSNDGRTFFATVDPLVSADTDAINDVYEYVDGRPQLISSGIGAQDGRAGVSFPQTGLMGASANGIDVYFATFDTLVPQDANGPFLKFYDARTGGGFPSPELSTPCNAADECHGPPSSAPPAPVITSTGDMGAGGNFRRHGHRRRHRHRRKHHQRHRHHRHRRHGARSGKHRHAGHSHRHKRPRTHRAGGRND